VLKFQRKTKQSFRICHEKIIKPLFLYTKLLEFDLVISSTHSNYGTGNKAGYWCFGHHLHWLAPPMRSVATGISKYFLNFSSRGAGMNSKHRQIHSQTQCGRFVVPLNHQTRDQSLGNWILQFWSSFALVGTMRSRTLTEVCGH